MKPILFNTPMVQAILDGRKTQFREEILGITFENDTYVYGDEIIWKHENGIPSILKDLSEYKKGDILSVFDETKSLFKLLNPKASTLQFFTYYSSKNIYLANDKLECFVKVTGVRVEKLEDISMEDIFAEGISKDYPCDEDGLALWEWIGDEAYSNIDIDDYVFVYQFERV